MLCNNIRGAHSWYFSEGYPLIADYLNREGVTLDYLEQMAGVQGLAQYIFPHTLTRRCRRLVLLR